MYRKVAPRKLSDEELTDVFTAYLRQKLHKKIVPQRLQDEALIGDFTTYVCPNRHKKVVPQRLFDSELMVEVFKEYVSKSAQRVVPHSLFYSEVTAVFILYARTAQNGRIPKLVRRRLDVCIAYVFQTSAQKGPAPKAVR